MLSLEEDVSKSEKVSSVRSWPVLLRRIVSVKPRQKEKTAVTSQLMLPFQDSPLLSHSHRRTDWHWSDEETLRPAMRRCEGRRRHNWSVQLYLIWDIVFHPMVCVSQGELEETSEE